MVSSLALSEDKVLRPLVLGFRVKRIAQKAQKNEREKRSTKLSLMSAKTNRFSATFLPTAFTNSINIAHGRLSRKRGDKDLSSLARGNFSIHAPFFAFFSIQN